MKHLNTLLPAMLMTKMSSVTENGKPIDKVKGAKFLRMENGVTVSIVDSVSCQFRSALPEIGK